MKGVIRTRKLKGKTMQWPTEKGEMTNDYLQNISHKTKG